MKRILIVEDNPDLRKITRLRLEQAGFEVLEAQDGEEAIEQLSHGSIDLILLDMKIPKRSGEEVCRMVKADPHTAHLPIILYSATEPYVSYLPSLATELDVSGWIRKPYRWEELFGKIQHALHQTNGKE